MAYIGGDERDRIRSLAKTNPSEGVRAAREVPDLWRRVQSLAIAAWFLPDDQQASLVAREALRGAAGLEIPNRIVSVSAWPLRVLVARDPAAVPEHLRHLLGVIASEPNPVRRADALILVLAAVFSDAPSRKRVLDALAEACTSTYAWKASWVLYRAVLMIATVDGELAESVASRIPNDRRKRQALRELATRRADVAPDLFWWA